MKKNLFLVAAVTCIAVHPFSAKAQKLQTYERSMGNISLLGIAIGGTEKYTYKYDDDGEIIKQGVYSYDFSGTILDYKDKKITGTYKVSANYKDGNLHGLYSVVGNYHAQYWDYGWKNQEMNSKLTGVFSNGKPNGTFTITRTVDETLRGSATLMNGKYVGEYNYIGYGEGGHVWNMKGQFAPNGKLTGKWVISDITADYSINHTFLNDVVIDEGKPAIQKISRQLAEGKIPEKKVEDLGFAIFYHDIPVNYLIEYLMLSWGYADGQNEFFFNKIEGWDFSDYKEHSYKEVVEVNTFTREGFKFICDFLRTTDGGLAKYIDSNDESVFCDINYIKEEKGLSHLKCSQNFAIKYGTHPEIAKKDYYNQDIYLTTQQLNELSNIRDSTAIANCTEEFFSGLSEYKRDKKNAEEQITYSMANQTHNNAEDYLSLDKNLYVKILNEQEESQNSAYRYRLSSDGNYLLKTHFLTESVSAININFDNIEEYIEWLDKQKMRADSCDMRKNIIIEKIGDVKQINNNSYKHTILKFLNKKIFNSSDKNFINPDIKLKEYSDILIKCEKMLDINDSLELKRSLFSKKLPQKVYKSYIAIENKYTDNKYTDNSPSSMFGPRLLSFEQYYNNINQLDEIQKSYILWIDLRDKTCELNDRLNIEYGKNYPQILKTYNSLYKAKYNSNPIINDKSSAEIECNNLNELNIVQEKVIDYIALRQKCDSISTEIMNKCGKTYSDVAKSYQSKVKSTNFVPDMTSPQTIDDSYNELVKFKTEQMDLLDYISKRQNVDALNSEILNKCSTTKNCKKAYAILYKSLHIIWNENADNQAEIDKTITLLQNVDSKFSSDIITLDANMKKVKTADDVKRALGL